MYQQIHLIFDIFLCSRYFPFTFRGVRESEQWQDAINVRLKVEKQIEGEGFIVGDHVSYTNYNIFIKIYNFTSSSVVIVCQYRYLKLFRTWLLTTFYLLLVIGRYFSANNCLLPLISNVLLTAGRYLTFSYLLLAAV